MSVTNAPPATGLTRAQADRLYLDWHDQVGDEVAQARALAPAPPPPTHAYQALRRDLLAVPVQPADQPHPAGTPGQQAATARQLLGQAHRAYASGDTVKALACLQAAARTARSVLAALGLTPA